MKVGFVGLGFATRWLHVPAVKALPHTALVGGVDLSEERRREWLELDAGPALDNVDDLLALAPDVVVVATPPDSHAQLCRMALASGAHVLCEKPFVPTVAEASELLALAAHHGRRIAVNHEFRYMPIFAALAGAIGRPDVGRLVFVHCTQFMDLAPWDETVQWRAAMPDRALFEGGVHLVDLLHVLVGRLPERVYARTSAGLDRGRGADAIHLVTLDYGDGVLAQVTIDRLCRSGTRYADLRVDCEAASLRASFGGRALVRFGLKRAERAGVRIEFGPEGLAWLERGVRRKVLARNPRRATQRATAALYAGAFDAFGRGVEPPTDASHARDTLRIIEAAYLSARSGDAIAVAPAGG